MPLTTVGAIIEREKKGQTEIVLTRRGVEPFKGQWCLPGGHIDRDETAQNAVIREVKEETGLQFTPHFLGYADEVIPEHDVHYVVLIFRGPAAGDLRPGPGEVTEIGWFALDEARSMPLAFRHNAVLERFFAPE